MASFSVGNKVEIIEGANKGRIGIVKSVDRSEMYPYGIISDSPLEQHHGGDEEWCDVEDNRCEVCASYELKLISSDEQNKSEGTIMQKLTSKIRRFFNPSEQKQYKAGLIDDCHNLTERGKQELELINRQAHTKELDDAADEIIAEDKENKK